ncbi:MAG: methyltransferase domain-containing protein [Actinobacteria bacterium]|nr:MAG: methyltransferase domain-containing protein [Actinomycetota bacterium]
MGERRLSRRRDADPAVAETLCEAVDLQPGWRVLDVACGSSNAAIAVARCGCDVVGIDHVPALLARGRRQVEAEGASVELLEGDAGGDSVSGRQLRCGAVGLRRGIGSGRVASVRRWVQCASSRSRSSPPRW